MPCIRKTWFLMFWFLMPWGSLCKLNIYSASKALQCCRDELWFSENRILQLLGVKCSQNACRINKNFDFGNNWLATVKWFTQPQNKMIKQKFLIIPGRFSSVIGFFGLQCCSFFVSKYEWVWINLIQTWKKKNPHHFYLLEENRVYPFCTYYSSKISIRIYSSKKGCMFW